MHKQREYAQAGIPSYLVADPESRRLSLFTQPDTDGYGTVVTGNAVAIELNGVAVLVGIDDLVM